MYESLKEYKRETYECDRDSLIKVMKPVKLDSYKQRQINSCQQKDGKSVRDFAEALQSLMTQAFATHTTDVELRDKIFLGQFEQGLLAKQKKHFKYPIQS